MSFVSLTFDRGSVVMQGLPRQEDLSEIPEVVWDARAGAYRAPARMFYALAAELRRRCVPLADHPLPKLARPSGSRCPELHPYQRAALAAWRLAGGRGVLVLPAGAARLDLALATISATRTPVLCLVPNRALLQRWTGALGRHGFLVSCPDQGESAAGAVTVATYASAHRNIWRLGDRFGLLIVDEVQHFGRGFPDEVLEMSTAPLRLGLTGGPLDPGPVRDRIVALVGHEAFQLQPAEEAGDYQAPFHRIAWNQVVDAGERRELRAAPGPQARRLLAHPRCQQQALALLLDYHRCQKTLVFVPDDPVARAVSRAHLLPLLGDDVDPRERRATLEAFRVGRLPALAVLTSDAAVASSGAANEVPEADVGIVLGSNAGDPASGRRVGRLLRPAQGSRGLVYQLARRA
jgi:superfamily II DNA or RNA helicase